MDKYGKIIKYNEKYIHRKRSRYIIDKNIKGIIFKKFRPIKGFEYIYKFLIWLIFKYTRNGKDYLLSQSGKIICGKNLRGHNQLGPIEVLVELQEV